MKKAKRKSDRDIVNDLHDKFGYQWFGSRDSGVTKRRLEELVRNNRLECAKAMYCSTMYYRIHP